MISVGKKLLIGKVFMLILLLVIVIRSIVIINNLSKTAHKMEVEYIEVNTVQELRISFQQILLSVQNFLIHRHQSEIKNFEYYLGKSKKQMKESEIAITNNHNKKHLISFEKDIVIVESLSRELFRLDNANDTVATKVLFEQINSISKSAVNEINEILKESKHEMSEYIETNQKTNVNGKKSILFIGIITAIFLIIGGFFFLRGIMKPINQLIQTTQKISSGNYQSNITVKTHDEIGSLIASFNNMIDVLDRTTVSRDYFNNILSRMEDSLIITDIDSKIMVVNKSTLDLLGYAEEEIIGQYFGVLLGKNIDNEAFIKNTIINDLQNHEHLHNIYNTYYSKQGDKIPVLFSGSSMFDEKGSFKGMIFIANHHFENNLVENTVQVNQEKNVDFHNIKALGVIPLTKREREVMKLIAEEQSNQEIAEKLFISVRTVETHRKNIMQKLHVKSVIALVKYAALNGII
ncbi:MAG: HAMP domain-containing protein [Bacteroidetes bacterium]|nr:HAMP domain-containing protein [Bacteroidota bacterium]